MTLSDAFVAILAAHDPWPLVHELRRDDPVHFVTSGAFWFVTRYDDVVRLLHDPDRVTMDARVWNEYVPAASSLARWSEDHGLLTLAPEDHGRIRKSVAATFTPRAVQRMELQIRNVVNRFASRLLGRNESVIDLLPDFCRVIPMAVVARLAGIPEAEDERFARLVHSLVTGSLPFAPPDLRQEAEASFAELFAWFREIVETRHRNPGEDFVSTLLVPANGRPSLSEDDVLLVMISIIGAGGETTASAASAIIKAVFENPGPMQALRTDRSLIYRCVDELLRFSAGATSGPVRFATCDFGLRGKRIRKGQMVMLSRGGACRDPSVYSNPDVLDLRRELRFTPVFGHGPHACIGASLARCELACMLDAVFDIAPPGSKIRTDQLEYRSEGLFRRRLNLPVEIAPNRVAAAHPSDRRELPSRSDIR